MQYGVRYQIWNRQGVLLTKERSFSSEAERKRFCDRLQQSDDFRRFLAWSDPPPRVSNTTEFSPEVIDAQPVYGRYNNKWRQRMVTVFHHPTDESRVLTLGIAPNGDKFYCDEPMEAFAGRIKFNDWSDYN